MLNVSTKYQLLLHFQFIVVFFNIFQYSSALLVRPSLLQWKSGLLKRGSWRTQFSSTSILLSVHLKSGLIRGVAFGGSDLIKGRRPDTWGGSDLIKGRRPDTWGGSDLIKGRRLDTWGGSDLIKGRRPDTWGGIWWQWPYKRETTVIPHISIFYDYFYILQFFSAKRIKTSLTIWKCSKIINITDPLWQLKFPSYRL
jgi:hypothetical protein